MGVWVQQLQSDNGLQHPRAWVQGLERLDSVKPKDSKCGVTVGHKDLCLYAANK